MFAFHRGEIIPTPVKSKLLRWYQEIQRQGITERRRALMSQWDLVLKLHCFPFLSLRLPGMYLPHCFLFSPSSDFLSFADEDDSRFRMFLLIMKYSGSLLSHKGFIHSTPKTDPIKHIFLSFNWLSKIYLCLIECKKCKPPSRWNFKNLGTHSAHYKTFPAYQKTPSGPLPLNPTQKANRSSDIYHRRLVLPILEHHGNDLMHMYSSASGFFCWISCLWYSAMLLNAAIVNFFSFFFCNSIAFHCVNTPQFLSPFQSWQTFGALVNKELQGIFL